MIKMLNHYSTKRKVVRPRQDILEQKSTVTA